MKKVFSFRNNPRPTIKIKAQNASSSIGVEAVSQTDLEIESILFWVECMRRNMDEGGDFRDMIPFVKSVISADLLILEDSCDCAIIHWADFVLSDETSGKFCLRGGLFQRLAQIRFIHLFDKDSEVLRLLRAEGIPLEALIAVPLIRTSGPFGCLAAGFIHPVPFTSHNVMLLAIAAEIISMAGGLLPKNPV